MNLCCRIVRRCGVVAGTVATLACAGNHAGAQQIEDLGILTGHTHSMAKGLNGDGSVVIGLSADNATGQQRAFTWTVGTGMVDLGVLAGGSRSEAVAVSTDGSVIVGTSDGSAGTSAVRWSGGVMERLGAPEGALYTAAASVSADGSTIVGVAPVSGPIAELYRPFRWTLAAGFELLALPAGATAGAARAVSGDGTIIVGDTGSIVQPYTSYFGIAHEWSAGNGHGLDTTPGRVMSLATLISEDGRVAAGYGYAGGGMQPFVARDGNFSYLGLPDGSVTGNSLPHAMARDGTKLAGSALVHGETVAWVWGSEMGLQRLDGYLASRGVDLTGWVLTDCTGISGDGRAMCGNGRHGGLQRAWVIRGLEEPPHPCAADFNRDGGVDGSDVEAFFGAWETGDEQADVNEDGGVDGSDAQYFFQAWESGSC